MTPSAIRAIAGQSPATAVSGFDGPGRPGRPGAEQTKTRENGTDEKPEEKPAAQRSARSAQRDPVPAAERVEIDDRERVRHEQGDQDELDRPAPDDPATDPDVARTSRGRARGPASEPISCWAAAPSWPSRVESRPSIASPKAAGGRLPPVVIVTAGIPAATNGPCS